MISIVSLSPSTWAAVPTDLLEAAGSQPGDWGGRGKATSQSPSDCSAPSASIIAICCLKIAMSLAPYLEQRAGPWCLYALQGGLGNPFLPAEPPWLWRQKCAGRQSSPGPSLPPARGAG